MSTSSNCVIEYKIDDVLLIESSCGQYKVISHFLINGVPVPKRDLYERVKANTIRCYTQDYYGRRTYVVPVDDGIHEPYLRTNPNHRNEDNLLSLPGAVHAQGGRFEVRLSDRKMIFKGGLLNPPKQYAAPPIGLLGIIGRARNSSS